MTNDLKVEDKVTAFYKTGKYTGKIIDEKPTHYVVQIVTVERHPKQGDLHHPNEIEVPFFHERKALAWLERANIPKNMVKPIKEEHSDKEYNDSLKKAFLDLKTELTSEQTPFAHKCLDALREVQKEYELMYNLSLPPF
jgi:kinase-associated protein B